MSRKRPCRATTARKLSDDLYRIVQDYVFDFLGEAERTLSATHPPEAVKAAVDKLARRLQQSLNGRFDSFEAAVRPVLEGAGAQDGARERAPDAEPPREYDAEPQRQAHARLCKEIAGKAALCAALARRYACAQRRLQSLDAQVGALSKLEGDVRYSAKLETLRRRTAALQSIAAALPHEDPPATAGTPGAAANM